MDIVGGGKTSRQPAPTAHIYAVRCETACPISFVFGRSLPLQNFLHAAHCGGQRLKRGELFIFIPCHTPWLIRDKLHARQQRRPVHVPTVVSQYRPLVERFLPHRCCPKNS